MIGITQRRCRTSGLAGRQPNRLVRIPVSAVCLSASWLTHRTIPVAVSAAGLSGRSQ
jgi:hypothetical protein